MDLTPLTDLLSEIPSSAWGALGGALLTLISVIVSNRHSRKQQAQQQEFESKERQRERLLNLRREIYLPAAEAFNMVLSALTRMLMSDAGDEEFSDRLRELGRAIARVEMIATGETLIAAGAAQQAMLDLTASAYKRRLPMMVRASETALAHSAATKADADRSKCIDMMKEILLSGERDDRRVKAIEDLDAFARQKFKAATAKFLRLKLQQETDRLALARELVDHLSVCGGAQLRLATAIRRELEASNEVEVMAQLGQQARAKGIESFREFLPQLEAVVDDLRRALESFELESDAYKEAPAASAGAEAITARIGSSVHEANAPAV